MSADYKAIDTVVNIWTAAALSHRPGWTDEFFVGKVKGKHDSVGISLEQMLESMDAADIEYGFLVAAKSGRPPLSPLVRVARQPRRVLSVLCQVYRARRPGAVAGGAVPAVFQGTAPSRAAWPW